MLVQLARDLGEDFHSKFWVRSLATLSRTVNHSDFSVIEALFATVLGLILVCIQHTLVAFEISCATLSG